MFRSLAQSLVFVLAISSSLTLADVSDDRVPCSISLAPPRDLLFEKAESLLNRAQARNRAKRTIDRLVAVWRKNGEVVPRSEAWKDLPQFPKGSIEPELVQAETVKVREKVEAKMKASVIVPESVDGQFVVEGRIISTSGGRTLSGAGTVSRGGSERPVEFQLGSGWQVNNSGDYEVLYILAVRTIKDAKAHVLDVAKLSFTVVADE